MTENAENILNKWLNGRNIQTNTFPSHNVHNNAPMKELMQKQTQKCIVGPRSLRLLVKMLIDGIFCNTTCASDRIEQKAHLMKAAL